LAARIIDLVGSDSEIRHIPYEKAYEEEFEDMRHREPDVSKLDEAIGFAPSFDLYGILNRIIEYLRSDEQRQ
jgi:UDP-glucose 4-epimerase